MFGVGCSMSGVPPGDGERDRVGSPSTTAYRRLSQNLLHDIPVNIREAKVTAAVAIGQLLVIDAHEMKNCRVEIVHVHFILNRVPTELVRRAMDDTSFDATAGQPHRETERM